MIIKKEAIKKRNSYFSIVKFLYIYFFLSLAVISVLVILAFKSEKFNQEKKFFLDYLSKGGRYEYLYLPNILFNALRSNFYHLEKINLEIPFEKIIILENFRKESIANGKLPKTSSIPRIKAKIIYNENEFDSDLRLKGDRRPHFFDKEKSSYKLELDKDQYIFGIKKFSLQKPRIRNYIHEWIFHELSGDEDIIKIKYDFLNLSINGDNKGLYVIEEGFGKELIERNKRRNGPIFSLNEDFTDRISGLEGLIDGKPIFEIYNKKFWQKPENNLIANIASQKLREFFEDKLSINEVFDLKKWAAYFAIIDLTATYHGALLKSVRLYYNPLNGLFEPIPYDGHRLKPNYNKYNMNYDNRILIDRVQNPEVNEKISRVNYNFEWLKKFFYSNQEINKNFYDLYSFYLNKISSEKYVDAFLSKNIDKIREINSHIYADYFFYDDSQTYGFGLYYFLISDFKYQAANIRNKLKFKDDAQLLKISENNYLFKPFYKNYNQIIAKKFKCIDGDNEVEIKISQDLKNFEETYLKIDSNKTNNLVCNSLVLFDKLSNKDFLLNVDNLNSKFNYKNFKRENSNFFLNYFEKKKSNLILKNNIVEISENIYIPEGYNVFIKPGQKIFLTNNAFIISNSPWFIGGKEAKTFISGKINDLGGGIFIGDTDKVSKIENAEFSYLNGYNLKENLEYIIYGSLNFHQTDVKIKNVSFKDIFSEDAINIFRSDFNIYDVIYRNISSDAIDIDFSKGEIEKAYFVNIKNDAIDFSGSSVNINNTYFDNTDDKMISAGENSIIKINRMRGINSFTGIVSKDGSKVYANNINFDGVKIPFAAYQKKNEYEYPLLNVRNYELKNFLTKSIKDDTADLITKDEILVMKSNEIISLIYEKNFTLLK